MLKESIRKQRLQKQMYRLARLTLSSDMPEVFLEEDPLTVLVRRRSALGLRLPDLTIEVAFPQNYPMEPAEIQIKEPNRSPNESSSLCNSVERVDQLQELPSVRNWNVGVYTADILRELIPIVRDKCRNELPDRGSKRPFSVVRNYRQKEQEQWKVDPLTGLSTKQNGVATLSRKVSKHRRKEENIETKNLNRHFRSKLREILRQIDSDKARELYIYFRPNCVGFKEIRYVLNMKWFNDILKEELRNGNFLRRIEQSVMGLQSKHLLIKYYPIIEHAVNHPELFERWKY